METVAVQVRPRRVVGAGTALRDGCHGGDYIIYVEYQPLQPILKREGRKPGITEGFKELDIAVFEEFENAELYINDTRQSVDQER